MAAGGEREIAHDDGAADGQIAFDQRDNLRGRQALAVNVVHLRGGQRGRIDAKIVHRALEIRIGIKRLADIARVIAVGRVKSRRLDRDTIVLRHLLAVEIQHAPAGGGADGHREVPPLSTLHDHVAMKRLFGAAVLDR